MKTLTVLIVLMSVLFSQVLVSSAMALTECKGDFDDSGTITSSDISLLVNYWLNYRNVFGVAPIEQPGWVDGMDLHPLNAPDGIITSGDISVLVNHWLRYKNMPIFPIPCLP